MELRRPVLLHSKERYGDFFARETHDKMVGGMSGLLGYVHRVAMQDYHDELADKGRARVVSTSAQDHRTAGSG